MKNERPWWVPDTQSFIAVFLVMALIAVTVILLFKPDAASSDVVKTLLGGLMTVGFASIISFYFGSSKGSEKKDDVISSVATSDIPLPPQPPAPIKENDQ